MSRKILKLNSNDDLVLPNNIYVNNHVGNVGETLTRTLSSNTAVKDSATTMLARMELPAGHWILNACVRFTPTAAGYVTASMDRSTVTGQSIHTRKYMSLNENQEINFSRLVTAAAPSEAIELRVTFTQDTNVVANKDSYLVTGMSAVRVE